jgi:hypothetical protein
VKTISAASKKLQKTMNHVWTFSDLAARGVLAG